AQALGRGGLAIAFRHILPNCIGPLLVQGTFIFAYAVLAEAILGFLGVGVPPYVPSWGNVIASGKNVIREAFWVSLFPGPALTQAMKAKDTRTADVVRMIKSRLGERRTAKGFSGTVDDALVLDVIGAYRKQLQKALVEFEKVGERGAAHAAQLRFELEFCDRYLPKGMDEAAVRALVRERLDALKVLDAKPVGRLVGDVMTTHKGQVDAAEVNR